MILDKKKVQKKLIEFLKNGAKKKNLSDADIASRIEVSIWALLSWKSGKRCPRIHVIQRIESEFGIKLLGTK